jgi:DNA ligase-1
MKKFPILYSRTSKGGVQTWQMVTNGDGYFTISGLIDGKKVTSKPTIAKGKNVGKKNETSPSEQAILEVEAKYEKQLKTGYHKDIADIDIVTYVKPMLAKSYKDRAKKVNLSSGEWGAQNKFNGNRCLASKRGLFTREGEEWLNCEHIKESLAPFFKKYPKAVLDGEFWNYSLRQKLNELSSIIKQRVRITDEDRQKSREIVRLAVYDGYGFGDEMFMDESVSYIKRKGWIDRKVVGKYEFVENVETYEINSLAQFENIYGQLLEDGQEGAILRKLDAPYEHKRSSFLLKHKPEDTSEGVIVNISEADGNWSGTGKVITFMWKGMTFDGTFKGTIEQGEKFWKERHDWIGRKVTFLYSGLTGKLVPNYARMDINNCLSADR